MRTPSRPHAAQPRNEQRIGVQVVADVEEPNSLAADVVGDVGVGDALEQLGTEPAPESAYHGVARHAALRAVGVDFHMTQRDVYVVLAEGFALGEDLLRDAAVGRESVEYDEQSLHGTLFSGPQACGEFFEVVRSAQLEVSQPDDEGGGTFRRQRRQVRRRCGEQPCDAGQRQREDRREQQRL